MWLWKLALLNNMPKKLKFGKSWLDVSLRFQNRSDCFSAPQDHADFIFGLKNPPLGLEDLSQDLCFYLLFVQKWNRHGPWGVEKLSLLFVLSILASPPGQTTGQARHQIDLQEKVTKEGIVYEETFCSFIYTIYSIYSLNMVNKVSEAS